MSSRVRQDEPPGRSRQRQIANLNKTTRPNFRLNFRLAFLSFVYFGKQPTFKDCRASANADSKIQLAMGMGDFERRPENAIETKTASAKSGW